MRHTLHRFDTSMTKRVASLFGPSARPFFAAVTALGDPTAVGVITAAIIGAGIYIGDGTVVAAGVVIPVTVLIGALLKLLFERARPITEYALNMKLQTFSFPSGHSTGSMITYGLLAYATFLRLSAPLALIVGCLLALIPFAVGISRVYLGAHFPSDVIAGWILGAASLLLTIYLVGPFV